MRTVAVLAIFGAVSSAHPMGNFSVSHYARIEVAAQGSRLTYVLDLAEIPSFQLLQKWGIPLKEATTAQIKANAQAEAVEWIGNLAISQAGTERHPRLRSTTTQVFDGAGAIPVLRVEVQADLDLSPGAVQYEDWNFQSSSGWKEVVITAGSGASLLRSNRSSTDLSKALTAYPTIAPPQDVRASFSWTSTASNFASASSANSLEARNRYWVRCSTRRQEPRERRISLPATVETGTDLGDDWPRPPGRSWITCDAGVVAGPRKDDRRPHV
jgi:hypothetical protein